MDGGDAGRRLFNEGQSSRASIFHSGIRSVGIAFFRYKTTELSITNKRIVAKFGLISRHTIEMKLPRVESVQVNQSILGRMLDYGSLTVSGAGNPMAPVPGISSPLEFRRVAMDAQDQTGQPIHGNPERTIGSTRLFGFLSLFLVAVAMVFVLLHKSSVPTELSLDNENPSNPRARESKEIAPYQAASKLSSAMPNEEQSSASSLGGDALRTYTNERFGFSIGYPQSFVAKEPPENGDGITLTSADGSAILTVSGSNVSGIALPEYYDTVVKSIRGELGYHTASKSWFVLTWKDGGRLTYQKTFLGDGSENSFMFSFPEDQKPAYDDVIGKIEKSFRHGDLEHAW